MLLTIGVLGLVILAALVVAIGTWSPTCRMAGWLSITTSDGDDNTLTSVIVRKVSRIAPGSASLPTKRLKPGSTRCRASEAAVDTALVPVVEVVVVLDVVLDDCGVD